MRKLHDSNLSILLDCVRKTDRITKREIQEKTKLSWGTVSAGITRLLAMGFVSENEPESARAQNGRPAMTYSIASDRNLLVGVDISFEGFEAVIVNLRCEVLLKKKVLLENVTDRDDILARCIALVRGLLEQSGFMRSAFLGLGFSLMGTVDSKNGVAVCNPYIANWRDVPIRAIFEKEFGLPVRVDHDPVCMMYSEMLLGKAKKIPNFLYIRLSYGIGMGILIDNHVYRGASGGAGEFGHITLDPDGPLCSCGRHGCMEAYCSVYGLAERCRGQTAGRAAVGEAAYAARTSADTAFAAVSKLAQAARRGDARAATLFTEAGSRLGVGVSNLISLFNPEAVIFGGILTDYEDLYLDAFRETFGKYAWPNSGVQLMRSGLDDYSAAIGAAALFIIGKCWEALF